MKPKETLKRDTGEVSHARLIGVVLLIVSLMPLAVWGYVTVVHSGHGHDPPLGWKPVVIIWGVIAGTGLAVMFGKIQDMLDAAIDRIDESNG